MKIPINFPCQDCGTSISAFIGVEDSSLQVQCECGHFNAGDFGLAFTRGPRILVRARFELVERQDFSMAIVLSAMAFEGELSRLHHKWEEITALLSNREIDDQELDRTLRRFTNVRDKIEHVSKLMHPAGLDDFVCQNSEMRSTIGSGFPSLSVVDLAGSFQKSLFWPRNRILHLGYSEFQEADAARCFSIAALGLRILEQLDQERRQRMA